MKKITNMKSMKSMKSKALILYSLFIINALILSSGFISTTLSIDIRYVIIPLLLINLLGYWYNDKIVSRDTLSFKLLILNMFIFILNIFFYLIIF